MTLSDKPKIIFSDIGGHVTLEARLPSHQIKQQQKQTPEQAFLTALYNCGESKQ